MIRACMQHCVIADNPSDNALLPPPTIVRDMNTFRARVENSGSCPVVLDGGTVDAVSRPSYWKQSVTNCPTSTPTTAALCSSLSAQLTGLVPSSKCGGFDSQSACIAEDTCDWDGSQCKPLCCNQWNGTDRTTCEDNGKCVWDRVRNTCNNPDGSVCTDCRSDGITANCAAQLNRVCGSPPCVAPCMEKDGQCVYAQQLAITDEAPCVFPDGCVTDNVGPSVACAPFRGCKCQTKTGVPPTWGGVCQLSSNGKITLARTAPTLKDSALLCPPPNAFRTHCAFPADVHPDAAEDAKAAAACASINSFCSQNPGCSDPKCRTITPSFKGATPMCVARQTDDGVPCAHVLDNDIVTPGGVCAVGPGFRPVEAAADCPNEYGCCHYPANASDATEMLPHNAIDWGGSSTEWTVKDYLPTMARMQLTDACAEASTSGACRDVRYNAVVNWGGLDPPSSLKFTPRGSGPVFGFARPGVLLNTGSQLCGLFDADKKMTAPKTKDELLTNFWYSVQVPNAVKCSAITDQNACDTRTFGLCAWSSGSCTTATATVPSLKLFSDAYGETSLGCAWSPSDTLLTRPLHCGCFDGDETLCDAFGASCVYSEGKCARRAAFKCEDASNVNASVWSPCKDVTGCGARSKFDTWAYSEVLGREVNLHTTEEDARLYQVWRSAECVPRFVSGDAADDAAKAKQCAALSRSDCEASLTCTFHASAADAPGPQACLFNPSYYTIGVAGVSSYFKTRCCLGMTAGTEEPDKLPNASEAYVDGVPTGSKFCAPDWCPGNAACDTVQRKLAGSYEPWYSYDASLPNKNPFTCNTFNTASTPQCVVVVDTTDAACAAKTDCSSGPGTCREEEGVCKAAPVGAVARTYLNALCMELFLGTLSDDDPHHLFVTYTDVAPSLASPTAIMGCYGTRQPQAIPKFSQLALFSSAYTAMVHTRLSWMTNWTGGGFLPFFKDPSQFYTLTAAEVNDIKGAVAYGASTPSYVTACFTPSIRDGVPHYIPTVSDFAAGCSVDTAAHGKKVTDHLYDYFHCWFQPCRSGIQPYEMASRDCAPSVNVCEDLFTEINMKDSEIVNSELMQHCVTVLAGAASGHPSSDEMAAELTRRINGASSWLDRAATALAVWLTLLAQRWVTALDSGVVLGIVAVVCVTFLLIGLLGVIRRQSGETIL